MGCEAREEFLASIVNVDVSTDSICGYEVIHGTMRVRTVHRRLCNLSIRLQVLCVKGEMICMTTVYAIEWKQDHGPHKPAYFYG